MRTHGLLYPKSFIIIIIIIIIIIFYWKAFMYTCG